MRKMDDIRSPKDKVKPKLFRQIYQPQKMRIKMNSVKRLALLVKDNMVLRTLAAVVIVAGVAAVLVFFVNKYDMGSDEAKMEGMSEEARRNMKAAELEKMVITEDTEPAMEYSFNLKMIVNGQPQAIPGDYGKVEEGTLLFSTDTSNGDIHVRSTKKRDYTLNDFFLLWGGKFNENCLFNHCLAGGKGSLKMTVNGVVNDKFEEYVIKPGDEIVIEYSNN